MAEPIPDELFTVNSIRRRAQNDSEMYLMVDRWRLLEFIDAQAAEIVELKRQVRELDGQLASVQQG